MTTTCSECGATKPDGLREEERAAIGMVNEIRRAGKMYMSEARLMTDAEWSELPVREREQYLAMLRAARAPLEAKARELETFRKGWQDRSEAQDRRIAELEAQLAICKAESASLRRRLELAQAQKPAEANGLPYVGTPVQVKGWLPHEQGEWLAGEVFDVGKGGTSMIVKVHEGTMVGTGIGVTIDKEGEQWRRIPPAQAIRFVIGATGEKLGTIKGDEAASPPTAAPDGVTTDILDGMQFRNTWTMTGMQVCAFSDAKRCAEADIRANLARAEKRSDERERMWRELRYADHRELGRLVGSVTGSSCERANSSYAAKLITDEIAKREERSAERIAELSREVGSLREERGRLLDRVATRDEAIKRLTGELERARSPKRCPADGMSNRAVGGALLSDRGCWSDAFYNAIGAKARELFTPVADKGETGEP